MSARVILFLFQFLLFCLLVFLFCKGIMRGRLLEESRRLFRRIFAVCTALLILTTVGHAHILVLVERAQAVITVSPPRPYALSRPFHAVADAFPEFDIERVQNSLMLSAYSDQYHSSDTTTADFDTLCVDILNDIRYRASTQQTVTLHSGVSFVEGEKCARGKTPTTLDECNKILRYEEEQLNIYPTGDHKTRYDSYCVEAITALDALYLCKQTGAPAESYWRYAEIAYTALMNQVACAELSEGAYLDWAYRLGQVYDYMGYISEQGDFQYRMYFLSAAYFKLACDHLLEHYEQGGDAIYRKSAWKMCVTLLYRFGLTLQGESMQAFFNCAYDCVDSLLKLELPEEERAEAEQCRANLSNGTPPFEK